MKNLKKVKYSSDFDDDLEYDFIEYAEYDDMVKCYMYLLSKEFSLDGTWTSNGIWKMAFAHYYRVD